MLTLPDAWTWDFWIADTGDEFHVFYLRASRALLDPERRHRRANVGHAVSTDLRSWTVLPDALTQPDPPAFDDLATWTGSVLREPDGRWRIFYTGLSQADQGAVQRISSAVSDDLISWRPDGAPVLEADGRWYEKWGDADRPAGEDWEAWRDPWVYPDPDGDGWHMLITGRARAGATDERGVVGHARSADLRQWRVEPPLSRPDAGFGQLEVLQVELVDGQAVLLFSCLAPEMSAARRASGERSGRGERGGVWSVPATALTGPFDIGRATALTGPELYSGRLVRDRSGRWVLLAFVNRDGDGAFVGGLSDPMPVGWVADGSGGRVLRVLQAGVPGRVR